jgi:tetratricopeptide (TPR) repeat protein
MAPRNKVVRETLEEELERLRLLQNFDQVRLTANTQLNSPQTDAFSALVHGELLIEDYLYVHGCSPNATPPAELTNAKSMLLGVYEGKLTSKQGNKQSFKLEAAILLCKVCYLCDQLKEVDRYFDNAELLKLSHETKNPRMLRLIAEAFSIKGLSMEKGPNATNSKMSDAVSQYYDRSADTCLKFLKSSDQLMNQPPSAVHGGNSPTVVTHFLEYAVQRVPVLDVSNGRTQRGIDTLRKWLQSAEIRHSPELRALLAKQLAELLLRLVSDRSYRTINPPEPSSALPNRNWSGLEPPASSYTNSSQKSSSYGSSRGLNSKKNNSFSLSNNLFNPSNRTEEVLLLLLVTECLVSRDLVLDQSAEHKYLREKRVKEEKFVLDLLTIVLVKRAQFAILTETVERGMKVAFNDVDMWYKFALCLICSEKYSRAVTVLQECHNLDPNNPLFLTLTAKVALQYLNDAAIGVKAALKALELSGSMNVYERARVHMLLAVAYAMSAESLSITQTEKSNFLKNAMSNFKTANEFDDNDPCIQFNYALCLANTRNIRLAKQVIRSTDDHEPTQELSVLLLTAEKKYPEALQLVSSLCSDNSDNLTLIYLKIYYKRSFMDRRWQSKVPTNSRK